MTGPIPPAVPGGMEMLRARVSTEQDVFAVRRQARELAAALGMDGQDEVRVAAALSEVGRRMLAELGPLTVAFTLATSTAQALLILSVSGPGPAAPELVEAVSVTRRLMDSWQLHHTAGVMTVEMGRRLPDPVRELTGGQLRQIVTEVAGVTAGTPLEELAEHNRQLLAALADVQAQRDELLRLNAEMEETNRGVMALYTELSGELEATNRGVVALYAELDQRTEQARAANQAKTRFLANVSHELRSPVTSIVGLVRLLRDPASDPLTEEQGRQLELVDGSARSLLNLVNELLDLAKAESGRLEPAVEPTELGPIFETLRGTLRPLVTHEATRLVVVDPVGVPPLPTDPILLTQILRNLLTNALKFTSEGEVRLAARVVDDWVELEVSDTGIGIPPEEQERVFEEFHQVRNRLQATTSGTGLGLPYARRLAEVLGGSITLTSTQDVGTTVITRLPLSEQSAPGPEDEPVVLVVDDDDGFRTAACAALRAGGLRVIEAADGHHALAVMDTHTPALILLDLRLPMLDGAAVLDALAKQERLRKIPVVVLSAYAADVREEFGIRGVTAVLDKAATPIDRLPSIVRARMRREPE
jgi:signal transduction histidine kinase/CheY-like chemotaxis protein